jgi:hypothetical protein
VGKKGGKNLTDRGEGRMNFRERVMAALALKEPDRVPFMDYVDTAVKQQIMAPTISTRLNWR